MDCIRELCVVEDLLLLYTLLKEFDDVTHEFLFNLELLRVSELEANLRVPLSCGDDSLLHKQNGQVAVVHYIH